MPELSGFYYLVLIANADEFEEQDEKNNLYYTTVNPKYFDYGYSSREVDNTDQFRFENDMETNVQTLRKNRHNTVDNENFKNSYTQNEILKFIKKKVRMNISLIKLNKAKLSQL